MLRVPFLGLSVPGPGDAIELVGRATQAVEDAIALVPRIGTLVGAAEKLLVDAAALIARIELTREASDVMVARTNDLLTNTSALVDRTEVTEARLVGLLDALEPPLLKLQPTLERLADTTDPAEVDALVRLIDHLPSLVDQMERDVLPIMNTLASVAPDLHDLLDVSRELNEIIGKVPGFGRLKKRVDEEQAEREAEREADEAH